MKIEILENEYWWGLFADRGYEMPYSRETNLEIPMETCDQGAFMLLSNMGRYIYSERAHTLSIKNGYINIGENGDVEFKDGFSSLRGAYKAVAEKYFLPDGNIPDERFFAVPQYNTWIELMYNQNQADIISYAEEIVKNGMPPGILMIDEGWSNDYGIYDFSAERFPDPYAMVDRLHELGFTVMLWVVPLISPDSNTFRELRNTDILLHNKDGKIAVREWWNGYSAVLDLSNPKAIEWFTQKLDECMKKYNIDGFKFDSADAYLYKIDDKAYAPCEPLDMTTLYNELGKKYKFNEFRAAWNVKGRPYVCRLQDKAHSWGNDGLSAIIPDTFIQGLVGSFFGCPDMIGGGAYGSFLGDFKLDEELYLRWIAASTLCPMMQFSIAPWRVLSSENFETVQKFIGLHQKYSDTFITLAKEAAKTCEPIVRLMEYEFPHQGFEQTTDCFMLGSNILVAPVLKKGEMAKSVKLPTGKWCCDGCVFDGGQTVTLDAPPEKLIVFEKLR